MARHCRSETCSERSSPRSAQNYVRMGRAMTWPTASPWSCRDLTRVPKAALRDRSVAAARALSATLLRLRSGRASSRPPSSPRSTCGHDGSGTRRRRIRPHGRCSPCHLPGQFTPDVALLDLPVKALDLAGPPDAEPLLYEGLREHYLPEVTFRGGVEHRTVSTPSTPPPATAGRPATQSAQRRWLVADPAMGVRGLRRRHLQPGSSRTRRRSARGDRPADRRAASPDLPNDGGPCQPAW
jgi:hypothetical protein